MHELGLIVHLDLKDDRPVVTKAELDPEKIESEKALFSHVVSSLASVNAIAASQEGDLLAEVIEEYCAEQVRAINWTLKTEHENRAIYTAFVGIVGNVPFSQLRHKQLREYKRILCELPANVNKDHRYRGKAAKEIISMPDVKRMAVNTANKHFTRISSLFDWARRNGHTDDNYGSGLNIARDKRPRDERNPFDRNELQRLFESDEYHCFKQPYKYWVPLIGLYTGARIEEICQLYSDDIRKVDDVWVFDINTKVGKRVKTRAGARLVPIAAKLIEAGLIEYANRLRGVGEIRLFPELRKGRDGYSQAVSKWFARYSDRCGVTDAGKVFHSLRHTFIDCLKQAGIMREVIAAIVGHADESVTTGRYGGAYKPSTLLRPIETADFSLAHVPWHQLKTRL